MFFLSSIVSSLNTMEFECGVRYKIWLVYSYQIGMVLLLDKMRNSIDWIVPKKINCMSNTLWITYIEGVIHLPC